MLVSYETNFSPYGFFCKCQNRDKIRNEFAQETKSKILFLHSVFSAIQLDSSNTSYFNTIEKLKLKHTVEKIYTNLNITPNPQLFDVLIKFNSSVIDDILEPIKERKADLIIMGTHGATGFKKAFYGSNTSKVISKAPVPVLAIPIRLKYKRIDEIVYSTDLSNVESDLKQIKTFNKKINAQICVLYLDNGIAKTKQELRNIKVIENTKLHFKSLKVQIDIPLIYNFEKYMKRKNTSVLCMFHRSKKGIIKLLLGSNTEDMAMQLRRPLLSFQKTDN